MHRIILLALFAALLALSSATTWAAAPAEPEYHARNASPQMYYTVEDYLAVLDAVDPTAAEVRGPHSKALLDLVRDGAKSPGQNYVAGATHAVAFDEGGVVIHTMLLILAESEDPAKARAQIIAGFLKGVADSGGTASAIESAGGDGASDYAVFVKGRPFGHVLIRQRGRRLLLLNVGSRYVLTEAASRERLLAPKLEALLSFVPDLVPAAAAE